MQNKQPRNRHYTVQGNLMSEKSSENYPEMVLCEDCAAEREIVLTGKETNEACEDCGGPDNN